MTSILAKELVTELIDIYRTARNRHNDNQERLWPLFLQRVVCTISDWILAAQKWKLCCSPQGDCLWRQRRPTQKESYNTFMLHLVGLIEEARSISPVPFSVGIGCRVPSTRKAG
jgi:hypothetical protein